MGIAKRFLESAGDIAYRFSGRDPQSDWEDGNDRAAERHDTYYDPLPVLTCDEAPHGDPRYPYRGNALDYAYRAMLAGSECITALDCCGKRVYFVPVLEAASVETGRGHTVRRTAAGCGYVKVDGPVRTDLMNGEWLSGLRDIEAVTGPDGAPISGAELVRQVASATHDDGCPYLRAAAAER